MFFKKYNIQKQKRKQSLLLYILGITGIFFVVILGVQSVYVMQKMEFKFMNPTSLFGTSVTQKDFTNSPETINKDTINILLLGRGGENHDAPNLTDSIILASISQEYDTITLFSIPRDLYVNYPGKTKTGKINQIYESFLSEGKQEAMEKLEEKITEITGQKIDYYVNIDFAGFIKIVDILGGVEVNVPENFVDTAYPTKNGGYTTFSLKSGIWTLDGEVALKYARSRHSTSDFDRSIRQQQIIQAIKDKILALGYFKDAGKIKELYSTISENIETDLDVSTMVKLGLMFKGKKEKTVLNFNLNDSCFEGSPVCSAGGFLYTPQRDLFGGQSVVLIEGSSISSLSNYETLAPFTNLIFQHPDIYVEDIPLSIYNNTKTKFLARNLASVFEKYGLNVPGEESLGNVKDVVLTQSTVYYNESIEDSKTLEVLKNYFDFLFVAVEYPQMSENSEVLLEIVLADDYQEIDYLTTKEHELGEKETSF